jgi:hypothetical protein
MVFSIDDSTEAVIQRKIEAIQRLIRQDPKQAIQISSVAKRHFSTADRDIVKCVSRCVQVRTNHQSKRKGEQ